MRYFVLVVGLAVLGGLTFPLSALVLDGSKSGQDLIVPVTAAVVLTAGVLLGPVVLASGAGTATDRSRDRWVGAFLAIAAVLAILGIFQVLLGN